MTKLWWIRWNCLHYHFLAWKSQNAWKEIGLLGLCRKTSILQNKRWVSYYSFPIVLEIKVKRCATYFTKFLIPLKTNISDISSQFLLKSKWNRFQSLLPNLFFQVILNLILKNFSKAMMIVRNPYYQFHTQVLHYLCYDQLFPLIWK